MCMFTYGALACEMKVSAWPPTRVTNMQAVCVCVSEHMCYDPKDGELCLRNVNLVEILMEACGGTDVQIVRFIWV